MSGRMTAACSILLLRCLGHRAAGATPVDRLWLRLPHMRPDHGQEQASRHTDQAVHWRLG